MNNQLTVERATSADLGFVAQDGYLPEAVVSRSVEDGHVYVARLGGERAGYLRLDHLWSKLPYIELIRVLEPLRRRGVGHALLARVESELAEAGQTVLYSSSQADEPDAQAWHRNMGFEEAGILTGVNEGGIGEVFFRKRVTPGGGRSER